MKSAIRSGMAVAVALGVVALIPVLAGESQGDHVLVTKPGVVFHKVGSDDIRGRGVEKTIDGALASSKGSIWYMLRKRCPCWSHELSHVVTTRTPRSTSLRASNRLLASQVDGFE